MDRLNSALDLIGYNRTKSIVDKSNILNAILLLAVRNKDKELEKLCQEKIESIRIK